MNRQRNDEEEEEDLRRELQRQRNDEDHRRELQRLNKNVQYLADKDGVIPLKLILWFVLIPGLIYGLFVGLMGIAAYFARHAAH